MDKKVVTSQHVQKIDTLNKTENLQAQRLYQDGGEAEAEEESSEQSGGAADKNSQEKEILDEGKTCDSFSCASCVS